MTQIFHRGSTNVFRLEEYTDEVTGLPVTNATVLGTLYKSDGTPVTGATNIAMPYFAGSGSIPAQYRGIVAATVLVPEKKYGVKFVATNPDGVREFRDTCIVEDG